MIIKMQDYDTMKAKDHNDNAKDARMLECK